ncbi:MAG: CDP-alcohol phosphatidyltransferase family protein [Myxococcales bacterium]|nr:CDP-alcohol phosphatidyltransferase family protein [Myxococcales bacterium]
MADPRKPLITANMVTATRLLAMPVMTYLIYQAPWTSGSNTSWWAAIIIGTVIACTDFVDGYLARKYGPTVFGGMLDPLADKIFVALLYLSVMDIGASIGFFPIWAVGLLFIREFLVTSIRSAYEWRGLQLKTSYFGKVKTWVQMQGIITFFIAALIGKDDMVVALLIVSVLPVLGLAFLWFAKGIFHRSLAMSLPFMLATVALFAVPDSLQTSMAIGVYGICLITWLSGLDYLLGAIPTLSKAGGFHRADLMRVLAAIATPVCATLALIYSDAPAAPVLLIVAGELAVGGLDNLLSRHRASSSAWSFGARSLGSAGLLLAAVLIESQTDVLAWAAMVLSLIGVTHEFWRGKDHYLDDKKLDEQLTIDEE